MNNIKIIQSEKGYKLLVAQENSSEVSEEEIAEIYDQKDALLLSYMIDKAQRDGVDQDEFKKFILTIAEDTPFISIPE